MSVFECISSGISHDNLVLLSREAVSHEQPEAKNISSENELKEDPTTALCNFSQTVFFRGPTASKS